MNFRTKSIIGVIFTIGLLVLLWYVRSIVVYVLISVVLALILGPIMEFLDHRVVKGRELPDTLKASMALVGLYAVLYLLISIFTPLLAKEVKIISSIDFDQLSHSLQEPISYLEGKAEELNIRADENMSNREFVQNKLLSYFDVSQVPNLFGGLVSGLGNVFFAFFSITFITFFLLKDRWIMGGFLDAVVPEKYLEKVKGVADNSKKTLTRYFLGLVAQISLITTLISLALYALGIENALVIGFFAGLINVIPYIGPLIGAAFGIVIAITTNLGMDVSGELLPLVLKVGSVFLTVQLLDNIVFQPIIFSNSINAHPLEIFLVIMVAGQLAGITGMVLAVPVYSFFRIIAKEFFSGFKVVQSMTKNLE